MNITVVGYKSEWADQYKKEALIISEILQDELVNIFHIGSTSVAGLKAKPVIDIMPVVRNIKSVDKFSEQFEHIGYKVMGEYGIPGRRFFLKGVDNRTHHVHVFQFDNMYDIVRHLSFRDYLRNHPEIRDEYAKLKYRLAEMFPTDIDNYCIGKDEFVKTIQDKALQWYLENYNAK